MMKKNTLFPKPEFVKVVEKALRAAQRQAIKEHRRANLPLIIWRDGKIVEIPASEL